jgi:MFS family permease
VTPKSKQNPKQTKEIEGVGGFTARFGAPVLIGPTLNPINSTMIAVALVPIAQGLHITAAKTIWLVAILYLVAAIGQPTMGTLADLFGPKKIYLTGLATTAVAGLVPLISHTFVAALVARVLIGIGTSSAYPSAMALIRDRSAAISREAPPALLSALSISSLVTTAIGPVLGGVLVLVFGWEAIFAVNLPLAGATLILAALWLPSDRQRPGRARTQEPAQALTKAIDFTGIGLFTIAIASLLVLLLSLSGRLWWLGVLFVAGAGCLVVWEHRRERPFIDVDLFRNNMALGRTYLRLFVTFTALYLFVNAVSQWLQDPYGLSASQTGLLQVPIAVVAGLASLLVARSTRIGLPLLVTAVVPVVTGVVFAFISTHSPLWLVLSGAAVIGIPQGLGSLASQSALYRQAPRDKIGNAAGLSRTAIYLGAIISSSIVALAFGKSPTTASMNTIGWIIVALGLIATALSVCDKELMSGGRR